MRKTTKEAMNYLLSGKKGNVLVGIAQGVAAFAIGLIAVVLVAVIVTNLQTAPGINGNVSLTAWQVSNNTLTMLNNFAAQLGLAGTVLGFVVIFGGLALLGVYAYGAAKNR